MREIYKMQLQTTKMNDPDEALVEKPLKILLQKPVLATGSS